MLNVEAVERIRDLRFAGLTPKEISKNLGLRRSEVNKAVKELAAELHDRINPTEVCGICGKSGKLIRTDCCSRLICDDSSQYRPFSFSKNSCYRNHDRNTLCSYHFHNNHIGGWQDCKECKDSFDHPDYVHLGTNDSNFEKFNIDMKVSLKCFHCKKSYSSMEQISMKTSKGYLCEFCAPDLDAALRLM